MTTPTSGRAQPLTAVVPGMFRIHRTEIIVVSVVGLILGLLAAFWPSATLFTVAVLFGSYLIVSGIFRITAAIVSDGLSTAMRWFTGAIGLVIIVAGIFCLARPNEALIALAIIIGIGWIAEGIVDIVIGLALDGRRRWLAVVSGVISIVAGIVVFMLPTAGLVVFTIVGGIMLVIISATTLLTLRDAPGA